jgi:ABC-type lipoprotein export system ATPase subunit
LFNLDYLKPTFKLNLGSKSLSELSPGERGALLLIFYLFLDKDDRPLIIDQPEENLDNQSVYQYLVDFIKEAKRSRQIIIVTHNPNLAVVCDAEQIIHMVIDKVNNNTVSFESGSIENPTINKIILDILEGTKPAFKNRTNKYSLSI